MIKDVRISVRSVQSANGNDEVTEFETFGRVGSVKGRVLIAYDEPAGMLAAGAKTTVRYCEPDRVEIMRKGNQNTRIDVIRGERNSLFYDTPYGSIMLGIYGEQVECGIDENGGKLTVGYSIDSNLQHISRNTVEITVREV